MRFASNTSTAYNSGMTGLTFWARRSFSRLALLLGMFCGFEVLWRQFVATTIPNYEFPWGHYDLSIAGFGALFLFLGWITYIPPASADDATSAPVAGDFDTARTRPSKKSG